MIEENDEKRFSLSAHFKERAQTFDDLQHEMAGRDVGRISRFLNADAREDKINGKRGSRKDAELTALQVMMMNDPVYAKLYRETEQKLRDVQTRLDTALDTVLRAKEAARENLNGTLSDTARAEEETRLEALTVLEADIISGQAEIGDMQERMKDEDNLYSEDELLSSQDRATEIADEAEKRLANELAIETPNQDVGIDTPDGTASLPFPSR